MKANEIKNLVNDEELEIIIHNIFKEQNYLEEDSLYVLDTLKGLYEETKYPGILFYIGESYFYGNNRFEKDETLGILYLKNAAQNGYYKAIEMLGVIYTTKALKMLIEARTYYELLALDYDCMYSKLDLGNNLMASYLIDSFEQHQCNYDQFYTGLGLVAESFQRGNAEANIILNVLDKKKKF